MPHAQVSMDFDNEVDVFGGKEKQFEMPDGSSVTVHNEIIRCPELMFRPVMDNLEAARPSRQSPTMYLRGNIAEPVWVDVVTGERSP